ncbi:acetyl-CoA C-acetyltransferase [Nitratireductor sp. L1-7-SE]|uniref:Acetyl-CoA C-acetyltransferase n=2 Tax=Nitratireductor rhodophyticola TaxID=2854036 RepID=A0ABS7R443_9HYPH|nr:acetyl-CoA C-acetyltransferase [Nitratireductor rhodophyticola]MBY8915702.1 acetyl-CoA C-acetyltransferase [Nitratireductor rhodophyticola]MBY8919229.1 acetyl-CoA C-acetyltransferase [Nitratireductor rhodophyticola]
MPRKQKSETRKTPSRQRRSAPGRSAAERPVFIVDGARTPFLRARGKPGPFTPVDLAVQCGRPLLARQPFSPESFDKVILGCVNVIADEMNPARVAALRLGMGDAMPAFTVQINCGSGMQSIDTAFRTIQSGNADLILAGGTEALSHAPLVWPQEGAAWFGRFAFARSLPEKLSALGAFRMRMLKPVIGLERGLTDPVTQLNMGQTAEKIGHIFNISREAADAYALESHQRLTRAQKNGALKGEVIPAVTREGVLYEHDDGVRPDTSMERLAKLKPVFEKPYGSVTPGNSSQITDGASWVVLASEDAVKKHGLTPLAQIVDSAWSGLDPSIMGLGPTLCSTALLERHKLARDDIDLWELNEAFAAQVLACLAAWEDADYCRDVLGLEKPFGRIDRKRLNVDGGAISLGHPVGTSGNRIVLHLVNAMRKRGEKRGVATECIGGGLGGAMLVEVV